MPRSKMSDVIVLLPGITGSVLKKDGKVVWGYSAGSIGKALLTLGGSMRKALALPEDDPNADQLDDGIVADALMPDLHLLPGFWKIDGYTKVADAILENCEVTEGQNFFRFPYDWRRDNRAAARKLARSVHDWLKAWRQSSGKQDARLILIAHSMGGLVSRYFLECLDGWKATRLLLTFGTPYRGSLNALDTLANGMKKGPVDLSEVARQFTALYQLLPVYPCYDAGDRKLARVGEVSGIPHVNAGMAASALAFHREIEAAVASNRSLPQYQAYSIHPIVGIEQETNLSAQLAGGKVTMLRTYDEEAHGGDGTVPRVSAIPLELSKNHPGAMYAGTQHGSLQNADAVIGHITGVLSGMSLDLGKFRKPGAQELAEPGLASVALEVDDLFLANEPIAVKARPNRGDPALSATLWRSGEEQPLAVRPLSAAGGDWRATAFAPPGAGAYRVRVTGPGVEPAEDAFAVADAAS